MSDESELFVFRLNVMVRKNEDEDENEDGPPDRGEVAELVLDRIKGELWRVYGIHFSEVSMSWVETRRGDET